ncbi:unnamed protein product [Ilex paraguariensis]|uniref:DUF4283 domain-containing protein n=1 Tax=Ilex paraguariensis TaxID=185542 RepID=A0ABC8S7Z2_9AQUA
MESLETPSTSLEGFRLIQCGWFAGTAVSLGVGGLLDAIMDKEMQQLWKNFTLLEQESLGVNILDQRAGDLGKKDKLCVFGKVLSVKLYNKTAFKTTMRMVWNKIKGEFIEAGDNLLLVQFSNMLDNNKVLESQALE